jgi:hypothetical protein
MPQESYIPIFKGEKMSKTGDLAGILEQKALDDRDLEELYCIQIEDRCDRVRKDKAEEE